MTHHHTAIISPHAQIADNVSIGPYCIIGDNVRVHSDVHLVGHVHIDGDTEIGQGTHIFPFASIGTIPQDLKYKGEKTRLVIGQKNRIREHVTINIGTEGGGGITQIGDHNLLMVGVHVGHDCMVGSGNVFANNATLAGRVMIMDNVVLGGLSAIHQFCRIGQGAMIGGMTGVERDVLPYTTVMGNRASLKGLNLIGLERNPSVTKEELNLMRGLFRQWEAHTLEQKIATLAERRTETPLFQDLYHFMTSPSKRGFVLS